MQDWALNVGSSNRQNRPIKIHVSICPWLFDWMHKNHTKFKISTAAWRCMCIWIHAATFQTRSGGVGGRGSCTHTLIFQSVDAPAKCHKFFMYRNNSHWTLICKQMISAKSTKIKSLQIFLHQWSSVWENPFRWWKGCFVNVLPCNNFFITHWNIQIMYECTPSYKLMYPPPIWQKSKPKTIYPKCILHREHKN